MVIEGERSWGRADHGRSVVLVLGGTNSRSKSSSIYRLNVYYTSGASLCICYGWSEK